MLPRMSETDAGTHKPKREMGLFAGFWLLVGLACLAVSGLSAVNTAFDLNLALGSHGSSTALPSHWDAVAGLFQKNHHAGCRGLYLFHSPQRSCFIGQRRNFGCCSFNKFSSL